MRKIVVFSLFVLLVLTFSGIAYAEENPFKELTQEQVIQKYFAGRQLDIIEGIWLNDEAKPVIIIKSSLVETKDIYNKYDYVIINYSSSSDTKIAAVTKTQYPYCYERGMNVKSLLRFISQTTLQYSSSSYYNDNLFYRFYTRVYPNPEMK